MNNVENAPSARSPAEPEQYDLGILGSGTGSKFLAWIFAEQRQRVATVERKYFGGSCPNIACLPSKNIIHSAKIASYFRRSREFGIMADSFSVNMSAVRDRKRRMVADLVDLHREKYQRSGGELILGSGRFSAPRTIEVTLPNGSTRRLRGTNVVISTGTRARLDPIPGLAESQPLTHVGALELDETPRHLIVIGGGYVGLELSQAMRRFGSNVTVIDRNDRLVHREDDDVTEVLHQLFADEGIELVLNACLQRISAKSGQRVQVSLVEGGQGGVERTLEGTHLLAASGRAPNTEGIGLDLAGVELTSDGYVKVNPRLETTAPGVWAVGDVTGGPKFTHISFDDFHVIRDNINGGNHVTTGRQVPFCLFTDPELARIGLSKSILGFTAFNADAGEIMSAVQITMIAGLPYTKLRDAVLTHRTMMEGLIPLFSPASSAATRSAHSNA